MLFPSFPFHPSGPFCSSLCSWLLGWTPSSPASVSIFNLWSDFCRRGFTERRFYYSCSGQRCSPPAWPTPSQSSCQTNGCGWLCQPAWSSTSWACRASPGCVEFICSPVFLWWKPLHSLSVCVCVCQQAGIYWVTLIDQFVASWVLLFLTLLEIIGVCYLYGNYSCLEAIAARAAAVMVSRHASAGGERFIQDIEMMLGKKSWVFWLWWRACWYGISPGIIVVSKASVTLTGSCVFSCFIRKREQNLNNCHWELEMQSILRKRQTPHEGILISD